MSKLDSEHGSIKTYVIGFVLSLIFTLIPYFLVVKQSVTGNLLLATILGFAVLQMIIQITFFLHLGRGPKPKWNLFFFISTIGIIIIVVGGSILIINNLHYNMLPRDQVKKLTNDEGIYQLGGVETGACRAVKANHKIVIRDGQVYPSRTDAQKCDTLTFINEDVTAREMTFGTHPQHGAYGGESELVVRKGRNETITLSELGSYEFHDHLQAETAGYFSVNE